jgi:hypothetical protein
MNQETNFLDDLFSPGFWDANLKTPFDSLQEAISNCWQNFCSDVELFFKLWILIFCPKLAVKFWPPKEYIRG